MWFADTTSGGGPGQGPSSGPPIRIGHALSEGGINPDRNIPYAVKNSINPNGPSQRFKQKLGPSFIYVFLLEKHFEMLLKFRSYLRRFCRVPIERGVYSFLPFRFFQFIDPLSLCSVLVREKGRRAAYFRSFVHVVCLPCRRFVVALRVSQSK